MVSEASFCVGMDGTLSSLLSTSPSLTGNRGQSRQRCRLNICSYIGWIDKYCICQFNQHNYKYWDGSAVYFKQGLFGIINGTEPQRQWISDEVKWGMFFMFENLNNNFFPVVPSPMWPKFLQTPVDLYRSNQNREESTILRYAHVLFSDTLTVIFTARVGTSHIQGVFNI